MRIQVILWDIDGTLLDFAASERAGIRQCFADFALGECTDEMLADYAEINRQHWLMLERGECTKTEALEGRFRTFFGRWQIAAPVPEFNLAYQYALGDTVFLYPHAVEVLTALRARGIRQYAATNGTQLAQRRKLEKSSLLPLLDGVFLSEEIGAEKPHPAFFEHALRVIGDCPRGEILIVGDSLTSDMQGGVQAGIRCCRYNPEGAENTLGIPLDAEIRTLPEILSLIE